MKKKKVGIIASSVAAIAVCSSMVVGSTLALFTSEDKVNIAVTSGKVEVFAAPVISGTSTTLGEEKAPMVNATVDGGNVTLEGMVPGDKVDIAIAVTNKSTISVKYQLSMNITNDNGLFAGLNFDITQGLESKGKFDAAENTEEGDEEGTINISVSLPETAGNAYQGKTCDIDLIVEAVQSNGELTNSVGNVELINTVDELKDFRDTVNGGTNYANKYVLLMNNLDLKAESEPWEPIGNCSFNGKTLVGNSVVYPEFGSVDGGHQDEYTPFAGTFNGNGKTISNFVVGNENTAVGAREDVVGLFGAVGSSYRRYGSNGSVNHYWNYYENEKDFSQRIAGSVTNLTVDNAEVYGRENVGGVVAYLEEGSVVDNVTVKNSIVEGGHWVGGIVGYTNRETKINRCKVFTDADNTATIVKAIPYAVGDNTLKDNGDKVGGIVGFFTGLELTNCTVDGVEISAYRDFGGIAGYIGTGSCEYWTETKTEEGTYTYEYVGAVYQDCKATNNQVANITLAYDTTSLDDYVREDDGSYTVKKNCNDLFGRTSEGTNKTDGKKATLTLDKNNAANVTKP